MDGFTEKKRALFDERKVKEFLLSKDPIDPLDLIFDLMKLDKKETKNKSPERYENIRVVGLLFKGIKENYVTKKEFHEKTELIESKLNELKENFQKLSEKLDEMPTRQDIDAKLDAKLDANNEKLAEILFKKLNLTKKDEANTIASSITPPPSPNYSVSPLPQPSSHICPPRDITTSNAYTQTRCVNFAPQMSDIATSPLIRASYV